MEDATNTEAIVDDAGNSYGPGELIAIGDLPKVLSPDDAEDSEVEEPEIDEGDAEVEAASEDEEEIETASDEDEEEELSLESDEEKEEKPSRAQTRIEALAAEKKELQERFERSQEQFQRQMFEMQQQSQRNMQQLQQTLWQQQQAYEQKLEAMHKQEEERHLSDWDKMMLEQKREWEKDLTQKHLTPMQRELQRLQYENQRYQQAQYEAAQNAERQKRIDTYFTEAEEQAKQLYGPAGVKPAKDVDYRIQSAMIAYAAARQDEQRGITPKVAYKEFNDIIDEIVKLRMSGTAKTKGSKLAQNRGKPSAKSKGRSGKGGTGGAYAPWPKTHAGMQKLLDEHKVNTPLDLMSMGVLPPENPYK